MADIAKFIEEIKGMTVMELNSLVKAIEEDYGVNCFSNVFVATVFNLVGIPPVFRNAISTRSCLLSVDNLRVGKL